jgi:hypothetical protein
MRRNLIRDDIRGGAFLNRMIPESPTDYRIAQCYYYGDPIQFCIAYYDFRKMAHGYQAELSLAVDNRFKFDRRLIKDGLAIFFKSAKFNNVRLQALISPENRQAVRLAELSGFTQEGRLRGVSPDGDRLIFSMLKEEYNGRHLLGTKTSSGS